MKLTKKQAKTFKQLARKRAALNEQIEVLCKVQEGRRSEILRKEKKLWEDLKEKYDLDIDNIEFRANWRTRKIEIL